MRTGLCAVRGAKGIHDIHIAQIGHLLGQDRIIGTLTDIHPAVFQQHQLSRLDSHAIQPVALQRHRQAEQFRQTCRHRRQ